MLFYIIKNIMKKLIFIFLVLTTVSGYAQESSKRLGRTFESMVNSLVVDFKVGTFNEYKYIEYKLPDNNGRIDIWRLYLLDNKVVKTREIYSEKSTWRPYRFEFEYAKRTYKDLIISEGKDRFTCKFEKDYIPKYMSVWVGTDEINGERGVIWEFVPY